MAKRRTARVRPRESDGRWKGQIEERLDAFMDNYDRERADYKEDRTNTAKALDTMNEGLRLLSESVKAMTQEVALMKGPVAALKEGQAEGRGMVRLLRWVRPAAAAIGSAALTALAMFYHQRTGNPPILPP